MVQGGYGVSLSAGIEKGEQNVKLPKLNLKQIVTLLQLMGGLIPVVVGLMHKFEEFIDNGPARKAAIMVMVRGFLDDSLEGEELEWAMGKFEKFIDRYAHWCFGSPDPDEEKQDD